MHRSVDNSIGLKAASAVLMTAWLFVASTTAQEPHSHDGEAAQAHTVDEHARGTGAAAGHGDEHAYTGLASDLPFWGIIAFIGFILAIKKLGWGSFTSGLAKREAEELRLISEAEALRRRAAEQMTTHLGKMEALDEEVRGVLAEAQRDAEYTRRDIRAVADREAASARARADLEIGRVQDQTLSELFDGFAQRVIDATQQRMSGNLQPAQQDKLIDEALAEFSAGQSK